MKRILFGLLFIGILTRLPAQDMKLPWLTDLPKAQEQAAKEKKMVLVNFTGSDWCPACKLLDKSVLTTPAFISFAQSNLVLVIIDSPIEKELPAALQKTNEALKEKYKVDGFPVVLLFDSNGKQLSREEGYKGQSANEYVNNLKRLKNPKMTSPKAAP